MIKAADAMKKKQSKKYTHSLEQQQQQKIYKIERNEMKDQRKKNRNKKNVGQPGFRINSVLYGSIQTHTNTYTICSNNL